MHGFYKGIDSGVGMALSKRIEPRRCRVVIIDDDTTRRRDARGRGDAKVLHSPTSARALERTQRSGSSSVPMRRRTESLPRGNVVAYVSLNYASYHDILIPHSISFDAICDHDLRYP